MEEKQEIDERFVINTRAPDDENDLWEDLDYAEENEDFGRIQSAYHMTIKRTPSISD